MSQLQPNRGTPRQTLRIMLAGLCVLLILFVGVAQLVHTHVSNEAPNPGCSLCAVAHLSVLAAPVPASPVAAESTLPLRAPETTLAPPRLFSFATYVRPPPALASHS